MSYQVLARKWRPQNFQEMVGQEHVLKALGNALDQDRLHHAYLFTGTRGVGKTTVARIFAKSLNCETGITSQPCGQCGVCREIAEGRFVDLIEIDAASRTKVEDMRELLDNVQYSPTRGRYKIYLIDEVHMLSNSSFNALLKTLEEPPPHIKFLLATTDPQKLPVTILSRCLQFNLKNLPPERIVRHLTQILVSEQVPAEEAALWELAKAAEGSMRDALSLTDQAVAFGNGSIKAPDVIEMLGTIEKHVVLELLQLVSAMDAPAVLEKVQHMAEFSPDYAYILQALAELLHRVAIEQSVPGAIDNSFGDQRQIVLLARSMAAEDTQLFYQIALLSRKDLALAPDPRVGFEMALLRMLSFRPNAKSAREIHRSDSHTNSAVNFSKGADSESHSKPLPITENASPQDQVNVEQVPEQVPIRSPADIKATPAGSSKVAPDASLNTRPSNIKPSILESSSSPGVGAKYSVGMVEKATIVATASTSESAIAEPVDPGNKTDTRSAAITLDETKQAGLTLESSIDAFREVPGEQQSASNTSVEKPLSTHPNIGIDDYPEYDDGDYDSRVEDLIPARDDSHYENAAVNPSSSVSPQANQMARKSREEQSPVAVGGQSEASLPAEQAQRGEIATTPKANLAVSDSALEPPSAQDKTPPQTFNASATAASKVLSTEAEDDDFIEDQEEELEQYERSTRNMDREFEVKREVSGQPGQEPLLKGCRWDHVLKQLDISGMTRNLAQRCVMQEVLGQRVEFWIDQDHFDFFNEMHETRIQSALSEFVGETITIEVVVGRSTFMSPMQKEEKQRSERQADAEREIHEDVHVQAMIGCFDAVLIEQSIEPVIREL